MSGLHRPLLVGAAAHALVALGCLFVLTRPAQSLLGVHPALKPFKFGLSIAVLLASLAWVVPRLGARASVREGLAWLLLVTLVVEMAVILTQAQRGTTSHFNVATPFDSALWRAMQGAIVAASAGLVAIAWLATARPLEGAEAVLQFAWRAGLWLSLLAAVSGFRMGAGLAHSVGGPDGSEGLWLANWSRTIGDLRVSHFISLHALQVVPGVAWLTAGLASEAARWVAVTGVAALTLAAALATLVQALLGRPFVGQ